MNPPVIKPGPQRVLFVADTFVDGKAVQAGAVLTVTGPNYSLLREAKRVVDFNANDPEHQAALKAYTAKAAEPAGKK